MVRAIGVISVACALAWFGYHPGVAGAARPQSQVTRYSVSDVLECGTFVDNFTDFYTIRETLFFNRAGDPIKDVLEVGHISNDVNSVTQLTLHEHDHFLLTFDLVRGTATINGAEFVMNRNGEGIVLHDTGRIVFGADGIVFEAGPHQVNDLGEEAAFCAALS